MPLLTSARALLAACAVLVATACTTAPPVSSGPDIKDGFWSGKELSFTVHGGRISDIVLAQHTCQDSGQTCSDAIGGPMTGSSALVPFKMTLPGGQLYGKFNTSSSATGSYAAANGTCCKVVAVWLATWQKPWVAPADAGSSDAGTTGDTALGGTTKPGSTNWGGASTGSVHPGTTLALQIPKAPDGLSDVQIKALTVVDTLRAAAGSPMLAEDSAIAKAAQAHADFYGAHEGSYQQAGLSPHREDESFGAGFTGVRFPDRMQYAGFTGQASQEVMAFVGKPETAVEQWLEALYHRLPLLDSATTAIGYGMSAQGAKCDVIDTAARSPLPTDPIVVWPWPGMIGVPAQWDGIEGPQPPTPPGGFPSGPVITAQFPQVVTVTAHTLKDATGKEIQHVWLDSKSDPNLASDPRATALYANKPLVKGATYTVRLEYGGNALEWRFTVGK